MPLTPQLAQLDLIQAGRDLLTALFIVVGALFCLLGAVGIVRMPDLFTRLQAATKTGTLGVGFILLASAVHFGELGIAVRALLVIAFLFLTAPVAAHVIARAAYEIRVPIWDRTSVDELRIARDWEDQKERAEEQRAKGPASE